MATLCRSLLVRVAGLLNRMRRLDVGGAICMLLMLGRVAVVMRLLLRLVLLGCLEHHIVAAPDGRVVYISIQTGRHRRLRHRGIALLRRAVVGRAPAHSTHHTCRFVTSFSLRHLSK